MNSTNVNVSFPSIFIPRVFNNITENVIRNVFDKPSFGKIQSIEMLNKTNHKNEKYKSAIIHLVWNDNNNLSHNTRCELLNGNVVNIMYNNPWFWKIYMYAPKNVCLPAITQKNYPKSRDTIEVRQDTDEFGRDIKRVITNKRYSQKIALPEITKQKDAAYYSWADAEEDSEEDTVNVTENDEEQIHLPPADVDQPRPETIRTISYAGALPVPTIRRRRVV